MSLPSALPFILAGLKLGIGRGLIGVVVAELFGSRAGLGRLISQSADAFNMPELFAGVIVLAVAGIAMTAGFGWVERKLVPWTKDWHERCARKLEITGLSKWFDQLEALRGIDLAVETGEFIAVVGPSGCGKTTFLRIVAGLEPASSGTVLLDAARSKAPAAAAASCSRTTACCPGAPCSPTPLIGPEVAGGLGEKERQRTLDLLKLVGLGGFEGYYPRQLSGGMRQRVNLARALAIDPDILLMDEPFASLDAQTREIMQTELLRIWEQGRKTVLFVTHQIDEAVFLADRVLVFARRPGRCRRASRSNCRGRARWKSSARRNSCAMSITSGR